MLDVSHWSGLYEVGADAGVGGGGGGGVKINGLLHCTWLLELVYGFSIVPIKLGDHPRAVRLGDHDQTVSAFAPLALR